MNRISTCFASLLLSCALTAQAQQYQLNSPDGKLIVNIEAGQTLNWAIAHDGTTVLLPSDIAMQCTESEGKPIAFTFGKDVKVTKATRTSVDTSFPTPFYKKASVKDTYNQLTLKCRNGYSIQFRAYDDGAAYRFVSELRKPFCVKDEIAEFNFDRDYHAFVPYINDNRAGERYCYSFESYYDEAPLSRMYKDSLAITPLMVELENGKKAVIMEAGLSNYPGMFLTANPQMPHGVKAEFAPYPLETVIGGYDRLNLVPTKRADVISKPNNAPYFCPNGRPTGKQTYPWRAVLVVTHDTQLANNDMMQRLAPECRIADTSWIKPGKVCHVRHQKILHACQRTRARDRVARNDHRKHHQHRHHHLGNTLHAVAHTGKDDGQRKGREVFSGAEHGKLFLDDGGHGHGPDVLFAVHCHGHSGHLWLLYEEGCLH